MVLFKSRESSDKLGAVRQFQTSDGATISYRVNGNGKPLLMLHGWSQSGAMFRHQLSELSSEYKVIVPDIRGHSTSPAPKGGLRMSRLAQDLNELLTHLRIEHADFLGWSMGASILWSYIDLFGTAPINKLVLVDQPSMLTILPGMSAVEVEQCGALFTMQQIDDLCSTLRSEAGEAARAEFVKGMITPSCPPELAQWIISENNKTSMDVAAALLWSHCSQDWRDVLPRIDRPTLVVCGAVSHVNKNSQYYIQSLIRGALIREFAATEGGAHFMFLEAPEPFNAMLCEFLRG